MQIYFHSRLCSYLPRVPILVEGTVCDVSQRASHQSRGPGFQQTKFAAITFNYRQICPVIFLLVRLGSSHGNKERQIALSKCVY